MTATTVWQITASYKNDTLPYIEFDVEPNKDGLSYSDLRTILRNGLPPSNYSPVTLVSSSDVEDMDYFGGGTVGLLSERARKVLEPYMAGCFQFLKANIRGKSSPYFFIMVTNTVDALDSDKSELLRSRDRPAEVLLVTKYVFIKDRLADPSIFEIPEAKNQWMFCTDSVPAIVQAAKLVGFEFANTEP